MASESNASQQANSVNITPRQRDLLMMLITYDMLAAGAEFILVRSFAGPGLCYAGGISASCPFGEADFHQLRTEKLITLFRNSGGQLCGKPTELGVHTILPKDSRAYETLKETMLWNKENLSLFVAEMMETAPPQQAPADEFL